MTMNSTAFQSLVKNEYGLTYESVGWTYQGKGNNAMADKLNDARLSFDLIKRSFIVRGICLVAANPTMIVVRTDNDPFCIITSLDDKGTSELGSILFKEFHMKEVPPEYNGCVLFEKIDSSM